MYKNVKYYVFLHLYTLLYTFKQFYIFLYVFLHFIKIGTIYENLLEKFLVF